jgi:hypothetical protein
MNVMNNIHIEQKYNTDTYWNIIIIIIITIIVNILIYIILIIIKIIMFAKW